MVDGGGRRHFHLGSKSKCWAEEGRDGCHEERTRSRLKRVVTDTMNRGCIMTVKDANSRRFCEQYTHRYSTCRVAHSIITFHHANTRSSRIAHLCVLNIIVFHVSCRTCPCLLPLCLSIDFTDTHNTFWSTMNTWDPMNDHTVTISDSVAVSRRQSLLQVMSAKSSRPMSSTPKRSILKISSPEELRLMSRGADTESTQEGGDGYDEWRMHHDGEGREQ